jgi:hypothetical protein
MVVIKNGKVSGRYFYQFLQAGMKSFGRDVIVAALAHQHKLRKGTEIPYIMHPFHVGLILLGGDDDAAAPDELAAGPRQHPGDRRQWRAAADPPGAGLGPARRGHGGVSHYNVQPVVDIFASVQGRDLGRRGAGDRADPQRAGEGSAAGIADDRPRPDRDDELVVTGLLAGLVLAIILWALVSSRAGTAPISVTASAQAGGTSRRLLVERSDQGKGL